jgi:hypothetical protein
MAHEVNKIKERLKSRNLIEDDFNCHKSTNNR